ncbi:hypothetical protein TSUD_212450 [Trifolium subterraneum]|uniref:Reverse transcriptase zinc-binding domain-containing protein n=1 Tax=Trifolium subterraneum TaxID=3900 RepID=A0A2Z6MGV7_TRISU|nr:hypothetical protein TSUD_212450 [Trifolium subterraneum]
MGTRIWKSNLDMLDQDFLTDLIESLHQSQTSKNSPGIDCVILATVWDSWATSKVIVFSWQLLQDRVPTKQNLQRRGVMVGAINTLCVFCGAVEESVDHLFVSCDQISPVWYRVSRWVGIETCPPINDIIFAGGSSTIDILVDRVKLFS